MQNMQLGLLQVLASKTAAFSRCFRSAGETKVSYNAGSSVRPFNAFKSWSVRPYVRTYFRSVMVRPSVGPFVDAITPLLLPIWGRREGLLWRLRDIVGQSICLSLDSRL